MTRLFTLCLPLLLLAACTGTPEPEPEPAADATPTEAPGTEPAPEPATVRLVRAQMWLNFDARIRWSQEHWEDRAARMIERLEQVEGIERAEQGMPAQIMLVLREDADITAERLHETIKPVWEGANPPLVDVRLQFDVGRQR
jgi:hypothetical protein